MAPPQAGLTLPTAPIARAWQPAADAGRRWFRGVTWKRVSVYLLLLAAIASGEAIFNAKSLGSFFVGMWVQFMGLVLQLTPAIAAVVVADNAIRGRWPRRLVALGAAIVAGTAAGMLLRQGLNEVFVSMIADEAHRRRWLNLFQSPRMFAGYLAFSAVPAAIGAAFYLGTVRAAESAVRMHEAVLARTALERQRVETRLQLLQAQIEPHFLFNTLATLRRLYQTDPRAAGVMMRNVVDYLEASLPHIRCGRTTLAHEIALCRAYLNVQQVRMEGRLEAQIDVPDALARAAFPPMLLVTLVENAVKHGVAPLPQGGAVAIRAEADGSRLRVRVEDTGRGWGESTGSGVGLANVRERLASGFGDDARMILRNNVPRGAVVTIELPLQTEAA